MLVTFIRNTHLEHCSLCVCLVQEADRQNLAPQAADETTSLGLLPDHVYSVCSGKKKKKKERSLNIRPKKINTLSQLPLAKKLCAVLFNFFLQNRLGPMRDFF